MAETQSGLAIVWSCQGITFTAGIVSATNGAQTQSLRCVKSGEQAYIKNDIGEVVGRVDYNGKTTLSISVVPSHASAKASAQSSADAYMLTAGTKITVADAQGAIVDGSYLLNSATLNRTLNNVATIDLEMEKFATDITTAMS